MRLRRSAFLSATAGAFAGTVQGRACAAPQFDFKSASDAPVAHPATAAIKDMWASVERESGGRLRVQHFPNSQLGDDASMITQLRAGALQFLTIEPGILGVVVPSAAIVDVGFAFDSEADALRALDGPLGEYMSKEIEAKGMHPLPKAFNSGMREITSSVRPIHTVDDMAGFKVRTPPGKVFVDLFKALGASPTPVNGAEVYTALQTKLVDGQETPLVTVQSSRLFEVQKYLSITNHLYSCAWTLAGTDAWKSLPDDLRGIVERNNVRFVDQERRSSIAQNAAALNTLKGEGLAVNVPDPSPFRMRLQPYYTALEKDYGPTAWRALQGSTRGKLR